MTVENGGIVAEVAEVSFQQFSPEIRSEYARLFENYSRNMQHFLDIIHILCSRSPNKSAIFRHFYSFTTAFYAIQLTLCNMKTGEYILVAFMLCGGSDQRGSVDRNNAVEARYKHSFAAIYANQL